MSDGAAFSLRALGQGWNAFFHRPADRELCALLRVAVAGLVLVNFAFAYPHVEFFWGEHGLLPAEAARSMLDPNAWTLLTLVPNTDAALWSCYWMAIASATMLGLGLFSRLNAIAVFVWLVSFHHRNTLILTGQDTVLRVLTFLLIFLPIGAAYSLDARLRKQQADGRERSGWALRVMQIFVCLVVFSAGVEKLAGDFWWQGDALYYVMHLDDYCCNLPVPELVRASPVIYRPLTWISLAIELAAPCLVWFKETRRPALVALVALHLGIEYMMNLFLFQWAMLAGWLSHLQPSEIGWVRARLSERARKLSTSVRSRLAAPRR